MEKGKKLELAHRLAQHAIRLRDIGAGDAALATIRRAAAMAPDDAQVVGNLGNVLIYFGMPREGLAATERALELDPKLSALHHNIGLSHTRMGQYELALKEYALVKDRFIDAAFDEAATLMLLGRWEEGWRALECRRVKNKMPSRGMPEWGGEPFDGTLWVTSEQGHGDVIQFARYLPWARTRCKKLVFDAPSTMLSLLTGYPGVDELRSWEPEGMIEPDADYHVPLMSLMMLHGTRQDACPQDPGWLAHVAAQFPATVEGDPSAMKVGLCWAGSPHHMRDRDRTVELRDMMGAWSGVADVQFYSFQVGPRGRDVERHSFEALINNLGPQLTSWLRTAAALLRMDLVITVDTAVAHLAAAMGVPTWILMSKTPDWRWGTSGEVTPWYPTNVVLLRQDRLNDWKPVFSRAYHRLKTTAEKYQEVLSASERDAAE